MRTYREILLDVAESCKHVFYGGYSNNYSDVIKAATDIYIAELGERSFGEVHLDIKAEEIQWLQN